MAELCTDDHIKKASDSLKSGDYEEAAQTLRNCVYEEWTKNKRGTNFLEKVANQAGGGGKLALQLDYNPNGTLSTYSIRHTGLERK